MLSRVADRTYWLGRYIERGENTARLVWVNAHLLLDLPRAVNLVWGGLIEIIDSMENFLEHYEAADERSVIRYLLADRKNMGSLIQSLYMARENTRTTREILPSEAWEEINELYLLVKDNVDQALSRRRRHEFLDEVIMACHQLTGLFEASMSHNDPYQFIRSGRYVERADMTTRILDSGSTTLLHRKEALPETHENILWMNVLRSLGAYQMYRQHVLDRVNAEDVVHFLLKDEQFPRSVAYCLEDLKSCFERLPRNEDPLRIVAHVQRVVADLDVPALVQDGLHAAMDSLQTDLAGIHTRVESTWFNVQEEPAASRAQAQ